MMRSTSSPLHHQAHECCNMQLVLGWPGPDLRLDLSLKGPLLLIVNHQPCIGP